jgi:hypothetical protein
VEVFERQEEALRFNDGRPFVTRVFEFSTPWQLLADGEAESLPAHHRDERLR